MVSSLFSVCAIGRSLLARASADGVVAQLGRKGRMAEALAVLGDAAKLGASPRQSAVNNVLRAAAKSGEKSAVYSAVDRMRDRADHVAAGIADEDEESAAALCSPTEQTYRMILVGLAHSPSNVPLSPAEVRHHLQCAADLAPSGVCDARTFAAAALAYLRCNNSVNHAVRKSVIASFYSDRAEADDFETRACGARACCALWTLGSSYCRLRGYVCHKVFVQISDESLCERRGIVESVATASRGIRSSCS